MGVNAESDILNGLADHLETLAGIWPISWPNIDFTPPLDGKYLRASFQPNRTETPYLEGSAFRFQGLLQITVVVSDGVGEGVAQTEGSRIARHCGYGTLIPSASGDIHITEHPTVSGGLQAGTDYEVPVTVRYLIETE